MFNFKCACLSLLRTNKISLLMEQRTCVLSASMATFVIMHKQQAILRVFLELPLNFINHWTDNLQPLLSRHGLQFLPFWQPQYKALLTPPHLHHFRHILFRVPHPVNNIIFFYGSCREVGLCYVILPYSLSKGLFYKLRRANGTLIDTTKKNATPWILL